MIERILKAVPNYESFLTVDELHEHARRLAAEHADIVRLVTIGHSTDGEEIPMLRIGRGSEQLLFFACPHPNEPIGAMTLVALSDQLVSDALLRGDRYTWNVVLCIDPDATRLNEGWFKGPFTITHYASEFYRPASAEQVEWAFPSVYKDHAFFRPIPETVALMTAIAGLRPRFVYSLHNAGLGGGYYYLAPHRPEIDDALRALMTDRDVPLSLGEPEVPWAVEFSPAIYKATTQGDHYDFLEKYGQGDTSAQLQGGETSYHFAKLVSHAAFLICELPYFDDRRVADTTPLSISRRESILQGLEASRAMLEFLSDLFARLERHLTVSTRFRTAAQNLTTLMVQGAAAKKAWAESAPGLDAPATVAQAFDAKTVSRFYQLLIVGMAKRALTSQLAVARSRPVEAAHADVAGRLAEWSAELEKEIAYRVIPIKTLVEIQLGAALHVISAL